MAEQKMLGGRPSCWQAVAEETRILLSIAVPSLVRLALVQMADRTTIAFVGAYDDTPEHLAGCVLGKMYFNITGCSVGIGLSVGVSTFASQNFGRGTSHWNGLVLRQCRRVFVGTFAFSLFMAAASRPLLGALGQPEEVLLPCQLFSLIAAAGLPALWMSSALQCVIVSQGNALPSMVCDGTASLTNLALSYALLRGGYGFLGLAWATAASYWISLLLTVLYVVLTGRQDTVWRLPAEPAAEGDVSLSLFLRTSLPSALCMWIEWWAAEVMAIIAGWLPGGKYSVGGHGLLFNTAAIFYMAFVANSIAASARIGNLVGAKQAERIKVSILTGVALVVALSVAISCLLLGEGHNIMRFYTEEPGILAEADKANPGMVLTIPPYSLMMFFVGVLRGGNLQMWGAAAMFASFYFFGIPLSAYLGLERGLGLLGVWFGNALGMGLSAAAIAAKLCTVDWAQQVVRANVQGAVGQPGEGLEEPLLAAEAAVALAKDVGADDRGRRGSTHGGA